MRKAIEVVTQLAARKVINDYAIAGAVAALAYLEPTFTHDLDVLVSVADFDEQPSGLILLAPIEQALADMGYADREGEGVLVEGWPLQFLPVASELDEEALREAAEMEIGAAPPIRARVLKPEHLVAKAVVLGRLKDLARVEAFLDQGAVDLVALKSVIERFELQEAWSEYNLRSGRRDPLKHGP